jgi:hypothetical protein
VQQALPWHALLGQGSSQQITGTLRQRFTHTVSGTHTGTVLQIVQGIVSQTVYGTLQHTVYGSVTHCVYGTLRRLGVQLATQNAVTYDIAGDPPGMTRP